jgi:hypothetical protein
MIADRNKFHARHASYPGFVRLRPENYVEGRHSMVELIEPIARLKDVLDELDTLSLNQDRTIRPIETALCHLQFAIDLLDEAQPSET